MSNLRIAHQDQHERVPEGDFQKRQNTIVATRIFLLVIGKAGSIPKIRCYQISSKGCGDSGENVIGNLLDAINLGDYAGLLVQCLTSLQRVGPKGFAARYEK